MNAFLFHALQTVELIHRIIPQLPPWGVSCHRKIAYIQCMTVQTVTLSSAGSLTPVHCRFSPRCCVQDQDSGNNTLAVPLRITKCMYIYIWNEVCYAFFILFSRDEVGLCLMAAGLQLCLQTRGGCWWVCEMTRTLLVRLTVFVVIIQIFMITHVLHCSS